MVGWDEGEQSRRGMEICGRKRKRSGYPGNRGGVARVGGGMCGGR